MLYENKCIKCSDKNCLLCDMINEIEKCSKCEEGYGINEGECKHCSENCLNCYFYEGKEQCWSYEKGYYLNKDSKCSSICLDKNCIECSMNQNIELCNKCEEGYKLEKGKCIKCQDINCLRCDDDKNICSECVKLTYLQNQNVLILIFFIMIAQLFILMIIVKFVQEKENVLDAREIMSWMILEIASKI